MLTFTQITSTVKLMDDTYDANFGEWIKNEENAKIVGFNLRKYVNEYDTGRLIMVVKWIVKDWTLRSIISLIKRMLIDEMKVVNKKRISVIAGLVFTWNVMFIGEFMLAVFKMFDSVEQKIEFSEELLKDFEKEKIEELVKSIGSKIDGRLRTKILKMKGGRRQGNKKMMELYRIN